MAEPEQPPKETSKFDWDKFVNSEAVQSLITQIGNLIKVYVDAQAYTLIGVAFTFLKDFFPRRGGGTHNSP